MIETGIVVGCALAVIASGYLKLLRPGPAQVAIDDARIPTLSGWSQAARLVGAVEVGLGLAVVATGHVVSTTALSLLYIGFVVFVIRLRDQAPGTGCGCIGGASQPPGLPHILVSANAAIICSPPVATVVEPLVELDGAAVAGAMAVAAGIALVILLLPAALSRRARRS